MELEQGFMGCSWDTGSGQRTKAWGDERNKSFHPVGEWGCDLKLMVCVKLQYSDLFNQRKKSVVSFDNSSKKKKNPPKIVFSCGKTEKSAAFLPTNSVLLHG